VPPEPASPPEKQSFWSTLPGILTQITALISAIAGLLTVLLTQCPKDENGLRTPTPTPDGRRTWIIQEKGGTGPRPHVVFKAKAGTRYTIWYDEGDGDAVGIDNSNALSPELRNLIPLAKGTSSEYTIESGSELGIYLRKGGTYAMGHIEER